MNFGSEQIKAPISWTAKMTTGFLTLDVARLCCIQQVEKSVGLETPSSEQAKCMAFSKVAQSLWFITIFSTKTGHNPYLVPPLFLWWITICPLNLPFFGGKPNIRTNPDVKKIKGVQLPALILKSLTVDFRLTRNANDANKEGVHCAAVAVWKPSWWTNMHQSQAHSPRHNVVKC